MLVFILFSQLNGQTQNSFRILKSFHCPGGSTVVYRKCEGNLIPDLFHVTYYLLSISLPCPTLEVCRNFSVDPGFRISWQCPLECVYFHLLCWALLIWKLRSLTPWKYFLNCFTDHFFPVFSVPLFWNARCIFIEPIGAVI